MLQLFASAPGDCAPARLRHGRLLRRFNPSSLYRIDPPAFPAKHDLDAPKTVPHRRQGDLAYPEVQGLVVPGSGLTIEGSLASCTTEVARRTDTRYSSISESPFAALTEIIYYQARRSMN